MPGAGLEPASPIRTQEPESCVFANFTIWAAMSQVHNIIRGATQKVKIFFNQDIRLKGEKSSNKRSAPGIAGGASNN